MRVEQGVKIFESKNGIQIIDSVDIGEYFLLESEYQFYLCQLKENGCQPNVGRIAIEELAIQIAKLLNKDNEAKAGGSFSMYKGWNSYITNTVSEQVLNEFIYFWSNKPEIRKTLDDWHKALLQSQQYADSRNEHYRSKEGSNHG